MRVLIVHASRYGSTRGIGERIGETLRRHGIEVAIKPVEEGGDPTGYDAVVIGSAAYYSHWRKRALEFVRKHRQTLANRPVWLFSSGPLGTKATDDQGRDLLMVTEPKEVAELREAIHPRDHRIFFGALDPKKLGFLHRLMFNLPANLDRKLFADGDFRDWNAIEAWAAQIAEELKGGADRKAPIPQEAGVSA
jgi:menaquinone-dependent protoporphyrinogen oxidase